MKSPNTKSLASTQLALGLLTLLFLGCASTARIEVEHDASSNTSTYATKKTLFGHVGQSGGLVTNQRVMWLAEASCLGTGCTPDDVEIAFINDATTQLNLDYRRIQMVFNDQTLNWSDESRRIEPAHSGVPRGEFMRITLSAADFATMVRATDVAVFFGQSGTSTFQVPTAHRTTFQALAEAMGL